MSIMTFSLLPPAVAVAIVWHLIDESGIFKRLRCYKTWKWKKNGNSIFGMLVNTSYQLGSKEANSKVQELSTMHQESKILDIFSLWHSFFQWPQLRFSWELLFRIAFYIYILPCTIRKQGWELGRYLVGKMVATLVGGAEFDLQTSHRIGQCADTHF